LKASPADDLLNTVLAELKNRIEVKM